MVGLSFPRRDLSSLTSNNGMATEAKPMGPELGETGSYVDNLKKLNVISLLIEAILWLSLSSQSPKISLLLFIL